MKMRTLKKLTNIVLAIALLSIGLSAFAEPVKPIQPTGVEPIDGIIEEVYQDRILIKPYEGVSVLAYFSECAVIEGPMTMLPGMPVRVTYDGRMTRSIPAQIQAETVVIPTMTGVIHSVDGNRFVLEQDGDLGQVIVSVSKGTVIPADYRLAEDNRLQVVTNGIMAMSYPPQAGAMFILPLPEQK